MSPWISETSFPDVHDFGKRLLPCVVHCRIPVNETKDIAKNYQEEKREGKSPSKSKMDVLQLN
ncbi:hypothetical protein [Sulfuracidifex tepidarius]|uniref:Uncharacterized protein n=1 Tax=Sulfuracidifex tepidarius TaxID=1294262 RepID=A0A510E1M4_9CREN|nr:hypothetical protein [Sulfuracidifex tepidarius]BBG26394.1 hypothetical protein IC007_0902 [Sulfuracidifex tepidarius]